MMAIGANLTEGYELRPEFDWEPVIGFPLFWPAGYLNASMMLDTANGTRETNVIDWTHPPDFGYTCQLYWWDKESGIRIYYQVWSTATDFNTGGSYSYSAKLELINSSTGVISPDLSGPLLLIMIMSISVPLALLYRRKKIQI